MSDFLARLAQRSLGEAPIVQPRLPGLFAPLDDEPQERATEAIAVQARELPPAIASSARSRTREAAAAAAAAKPTPSRAPAAAGEEKNDLVPRPEEEPQATPPSADEGEAAAPQCPAPEAGAATKSRTSRVLLVEKAAPRAELPPLLPLARPRREARAKQSAAEPAGAPYPEREPGEAPAVHITIGRVEVRASIAAPTPPARPRPQHKPALSLADYLKRGAGKP